MAGGVASDSMLLGTRSSGGSAKSSAASGGGIDGKSGVILVVQFSPRQRVSKVSASVVFVMSVASSGSSLPEVFTLVFSNGTAQKCTFRRHMWCDKFSTCNPDRSLIQDQDLSCAVCFIHRCVMQYGA